MYDEATARRKKVAERKYNEMKARADQFWSDWNRGLYSKASKVCIFQDG